MNVKFIIAGIVVVLLGGLSTDQSSFLSVLSLVSAENTDTIPEIPTKGMVTMVDLGATKCIPCKMMAPILEELKTEYKGRASIIFIDVWQHKDQGEKFKIRTIPTQVFFDKEGKEVERHTGFLDKKTIIEKLVKLGVK
ncbi:thioredoxin family protein [bacterium]|nr:thioredoxin family protein [bacterium]